MSNPLLTKILSGEPLPPIRKTDIVCRNCGCESCEKVTPKAYRCNNCTNVFIPTENATSTAAIEGIEEQQTIDPKGAEGSKKHQLQLIPPVINEHMAGALALGASKYGAWNWRKNKVEIMTYLGAMRRHIDAVIEGEHFDQESGVHHLGHVAAGCAIVLDAGKHGNLIDNTPSAPQ